MYLIFVVFDGVTVLQVENMILCRYMCLNINHFFHKSLDISFTQQYVHSHVVFLSSADKSNLLQIMYDAVARRRAKLTAENSDDSTDKAKNIKDMIDAALALNLDDDVMISDLVTFFIGGFHTTASCEFMVLS